VLSLCDGLGEGFRDGHVFSVWAVSARA
jgi:hypothetical protein